MIVLTESNNPFKPKTPEVIRGFMEDYGLTFKMFDEAIAEDNDTNYIFSLLYEAEVAFNEMMVTLKNKTANAIIMNEDDSSNQQQQAKQTFWQSFKQFISKLFTGIANFFRRLWAAIANDEKLFLQASRNIPPNATAEPDAYDSEMMKAVQIITDNFTKDMNELQNELVKTSNENPVNVEKVKDVLNRINERKNKFDSDIETLEKNSQEKVKSKPTLNAQQISNELKGNGATILKNSIQQLEKLVENIANFGKNIAQKGENTAKTNPQQNTTTVTQNAQNTQTSTMQASPDAMNSSAYITIANGAKDIASKVSSVTGKTNRLRDKNGRFCKRLSQTQVSQSAPNQDTNGQTITVNGTNTNANANNNVQQG